MGLTQGDFAASNLSFSELLIADEPEVPPKEHPGNTEKGKGWNLQVEPTGSKEAGRSWWPQVGSKPAPLSEDETTQVSAFKGLDSPGAQEKGWDLEVDAAVPKGAKIKASIGIIGRSDAETEGASTQVLAFEELPDSP